MIRLDIINDGTGNEIVGSYDAVLIIPGPLRGRYGAVPATYRARVEHHTRSNGWDSLVYLAVKALQQQMKGGEVKMETTEGMSTVQVAYSGAGSRQEILRNVAQNLKTSTPAGFTLQSVSIDGEEITSDELEGSLNES